MVILNLMNYFNEKQKSSTMKILIILKIIRNQTITMFIKCKKHEMIHILSKISQKLILNYAISISWQIIRFKSWRCYLDVNVNLSPTLRKNQYMHDTMRLHRCWWRVSETKYVLVTISRRWRRFWSYLSSTCCIWYTVYHIQYLRPSEIK